MPDLTASLLISSSGLQAQTVRQATSANNVANALSNGYKRLETRFSSQAAGSQPAGVVARPGQDAGVQALVAASGRDGDLAVSGNGFFVVSDRPGGGDLLLTRAGSFRPDGDGYLRNAQGYYLQGFGPGGGDGTADLGPIQVTGATPAPGATGTTGIETAADGTLSAILEDGSRQVIAQVPLATVTNPDGLVGQSGTVFGPSADSGDFVVQAPGAGGAGRIVAGALEASGVDLSEEAFTQILTKNAYAANARALMVSASMTQTLVDMKR